MPSLTSLLHKLLCTPKPSARDQAYAHIASLERQAIADLQSALHTVLSHTSGQLTSTWTCHACTYRNAIILLPGEHPLGILSCKYCAHVCCDSCSTNSPLLKTYYTEGAELRLRDRDYGELPYVVVCRECGVSWRAVATSVVEKEGDRELVNWGFGKRKCVCGARPSIWKSWIGFRVREGQRVEGDTGALLSVLTENLKRGVAE
ncbi:hypothetical protein BU26DRAFT_570729 [Trematosphaeria pertusa]|uniref:Probable double zinc ribbon domain-containing protein n=1 Tax=Trematosphaeria pertusa TaxID=390896 RepID=A0A6A6HX56_9PLEO|nr:uncharacterized protein BU26DRAFT_570729 [Trematosphaeria pertusa]KAF2242666.1 hypothetical protein BU26DRAFT_570729 [Trematosphaeria pertusa]